MIRNIIFDMGNVLLRYDPEVPLDLYCQTEAEKDVIRKELFEGEEWVLGDLGLITNEEKYERIRMRIPESMHPALKRCVFKWSVCLKPVPGASAFCAYAKEKGYRLYVLSNASDEFYDYFPNFAPLSYFDGIVVSADLHKVKPDTAIFEHLLQTYQLLPEECLFIDDMEANVKGAMQIGMKGEVFLGDFEVIKKKYHL